MDALKKILKWTGITIAALVALVVLLLCIATWWLTPDRLTRIINKEASESVNADVQASDVRFTLWSTFPHLVLEADSLSVRSRNFDSLPAATKSRIPAGSDFLLSTGHVRGGVNVIKLIGGEWWLSDVKIKDLKANLVAVSDSLKNYDIIPSGGSSHMPRFKIKGMEIDGKGEIRYSSIPTSTNARVLLSHAKIEPIPGKDNEYKIGLLGDVWASSGRMQVFHDFPFGLDGDVKVRFKPFGVSTTNYNVTLGHVAGNLTLDMDFGDDSKVNTFDYRLDNVEFRNILDLLPDGTLPILRRLSVRAGMLFSARLTSPYSLSSPYLPSAEVTFSIPSGEVGYTYTDGKTIRANHVDLQGRFIFDGKDPAASYVDIPEFKVDGMGMEVGLSARITGLTDTPELRATLHGTGDLGAMAREIDPLAKYNPKGEFELDAEMSFTMGGETIHGHISKLVAESKSLSFGKDDWRMELTGLTAQTGELPDVTRSGDLYTIKVHGDNATMRMPGNKIRLDQVSMALRADRMKKPQKSPKFVAPAEWTSDTATMRRISHTPEFIRFHAPKSMLKYMQEWRTRLDLKVKSGEVQSRDFQARNTLQNLDFTASFDSLRLHGVDLASGSTRGHFSARVANLRQFITSPTPAPLVVDIDARVDTVQINQLAKAYAKGHPHSAIAKGNKKEMAGRNDTVSHIIPRNLVADVRLTAMQTRYINLHLNNLWGNMKIADGRADIDTLSVGSDFGTGALSLYYDSSDLQRMKMGADLSFLDVNVVNFFKNFHSLLVMWPEMKNLSGMLSLNLAGHFDMFPNMCMNVPSLWAEVYVDGWDLKLHQNHFIRHVTRMLMMPGSSDLHIADMKIRGAVHGNLLEVFPFTFDVSNYKLKLQGVNNFNGDMFYHIGVEQWPLRLPFGINIKGHYHHPLIRFGGKDWHDIEGAKITAGVMDYDRLNVLSEVRKYLGEFVHSAASYEEE